jgi:hypothetical protein
MKTRITEMFGIQHPIIQGGMHHVGRGGLIHDKPKVQQLIDNIMAEAEGIIQQRLHGFL